MIGSIVSHYKILGKLGEGGMGEVYLAEDTKLDRKVALKFLPSHLTKNEADLARFVREAKAAAALNHPSVCTIHEIYDEGDNPFIVMEYVDGKTLKDIIQDAQKEPIPLSNVIDYTAQIGEALKTAHANGIVHRDIKAENIMVTNTGVVKVMDFGLAKLSDSEKLTKDTSTLGTVAYMSPEQIEGKEVDARADIFSFAVVLYEMLSCRMPFKGDYDSATMYAIINEEPEPIQKHRSDLSSEMLHVLNRALEKDPEERYQNVGDMLIDLKRVSKEVSSDKIEHAKTDWLTEKKPVWKKPLALIAAVLVLATIIIGIILTSGGDDGTYRDKWIAVLPFDPITKQQEDTIFCDGFHNALITQLQKIGDLHPLAGRTMMTYRNSDKRLTEISRDLGVKYILAGGVQRSGNLLSINVQLINGTNEDPVWAEDYERDYSDIFSVQREIAQSVAQRCKAKITTDEQNALAYIPTENLEAYELYQKAKFYYDTRGTSYRLLAAKYLEKAVSLDSRFVLAYALLSNLYQQLYLDTDDPLYVEKTETVQATAEKIEPNLPEVHAAKSTLLYVIKKDYRNSLKFAQMALAGAPNSSYLHLNMGWCLMGLGKFDEAINSYKRSYELDPNGVWNAAWLSILYRFKKKWIESEKWADNLINKHPELHWGYNYKARIYLDGYGQIEKAQGIIEKGMAFAENPEGFIYPRWIVEIYSRDYKAAYEIIKAENFHFLKVITLDLMGREAEVGMLRDSLIAVYEQRLVDYSEISSTHRRLSWLYAKAGRKEDAIREGMKTVELDLMHGLNSINSIIMIYINTGEHEKAIEMISSQLTEPFSTVTKWQLRLDPQFDPLREDPRFQELIE